MKKEDIKEGVYLFYKIGSGIEGGTMVVKCVNSTIMDVETDDDIFYFYVENISGNLMKVSNLDCIHPSELIGGEYRKKEFEIRIGSQEFRNLIIALKNNKK